MADDRTGDFEAAAQQSYQAFLPYLLKAFEVDQVSGLTPTQKARILEGARLLLLCRGDHDDAVEGQALREEIVACDGKEHLLVSLAENYVLAEFEYMNQDRGSSPEANGQNGFGLFHNRGIGPLDSDFR